MVDAVFKKKTSIAAENVWRSVAVRTKEAVWVKEAVWNKNNRSWGPGLGLAGPESWPKRSAWKVSLEGQLATSAWKVDLEGWKVDLEGQLGRLGR